MNTSPKFSIVLITKNEGNTLERCMESLKEFRVRGGDIVICDTGSTDKTVEIGRSYGCNVVEVGERFITTIDEDLAKKLNERFVIDNEEPIVKAGNRLFDFASARNYATSLAKNDMVCSLDADEAYSSLDIDKLNNLIDEGYQQFEYQFVFAFDQFNKPAVQFIQSKFFDRRVVQWTGCVHEVLDGNAKRLLLTEDVIKLEHRQEQGKEHRGNYLVGLALDCYQHPDKDRQSHYFAREMMWCGRPKSAIKEFKRHIDMNRWQTERAQSMIYIGDCYGMLNNPDKQIEAYSIAFGMDSNRREALMKTAYFYRHNVNHRAVIAYATAALTIPLSDYYANDIAMYEHAPHELLYHAYGWTGDIESARKHILKALEYQPNNKKYLEDTKYYFDKPLYKISFIIPTLGRPEGLQRCLDSIKKLNYPQSLIETIVLDGEGTVPNKVAQGLKQSTGDYIVFGSNDVEFTPDSLTIALQSGKALTAFNTGIISQDKGNICEHFIIKRDFIDKIGGEIFDTDFYHVGCDNLLWAKASKLNEAVRCDGAIVHHYHFSNLRAGYDDVYKKGWSHVDEDRELLKVKLANL